MKPYFEINHVAGLVLLVAIPAWGMMELSQRSNVPQTRDGAIRVRSGGFWIGAVLCLIIGAAAVNLAPRLVPAAAIRPGAVAFAVGMVFLVGGLVLRGWSFKALGDYFTHTVMVTSDQPVIASGPYRVLRHPSYTGPARLHGDRPGIRELGRRGRRDAAHAHAVAVPHPCRGEGTADDGRRPVQDICHAAQAPRSPHLVTGGDET